MSEIITPTAELTLQDHFAPFEAQAKEWMEKASQIKVTDESQTDLMKEARKARLALSKIRTSVEATRVELKEEYIRKGNAIQEVANRLRDMIKPIEAVLQEQEDFAEIQKANRKKELFDARLLQLTTYISKKDAELFPLADMQPEAFENMLLGYKVAKEQKEKADKEEKERIAKEKSDREAENKRIREENEQLNKLRERIRCLTKIGAIESSEVVELHDKKTGHDKFATINNLKIWPDEKFEECLSEFHKTKINNEEIEKKEKEEAIRKQKLLEDKLKKEREERKRLEQEAQDIAAEKLAKAAAERKLKRAPDKDKLIAFAGRIHSLHEEYLHITLKDEDSLKILRAGLKSLLDLGHYIKDNSEKL